MMQFLYDFHSLGHNLYNDPDKSVYSETCI